MKSAPLRLLLLVWVCMAALASVACIGNSPQSYFFPPPNNEVGQTVSKSVDSNGGTLQVGNGAAALTIPPGALAGATAVTVTVKDKALSPNAALLLSQVFNFGPDGTQFAQPVSIAVLASDPPPTGLRAVLAFLNAQGSWQVVPNSSYNGTSQTVTAAVSHFTDFAVLLVDAQGAGCASSPDPGAFCSPGICAIAPSLCVPAGTVTAFDVGGSLTGLTGGTLVLTDNGNDALTLAADGNFVFATALDDNSAYSVAVARQPNAQLCQVAHGKGAIAAADITQVTVNCAPTYAIGGVVTGLLAGHAVVLQNGNDQATVGQPNSNFVIDRALAGAAFAVTVATMPIGQRCELTGATGVVGQGDVNTVRVVCSVLSYPVGGQVQGLVAATQVTLRNGNDSLAVGNGNFAFPTPVLYGGNFAATLVSPQGQTCAFVGASSGASGTAAATQLAVTCTSHAFILGGQISGLVGQTQVTLTQGTDMQAAGNGPYTLPTSVAYGTDYHITTATAAGQTCRFADGNTFLRATMPAANVTNANLICTPATYSIGGTVTGLVGQANVILQNGSDSISVYNGSYTFATSLPYGGTYAATLTSPAGQTCGFSGQYMGTVGAANVTNIAVACTPLAYSVGGSVSGLLGNNSVVLHNGADTISVSNGPYTFPTSVAFANPYYANLTSPAGQTCSFSPSGSNAGSMGAGAATGVNVVCGPKVYNLGGHVTGLRSNTSVGLSDGTDSINAANGSFTFPTGLSYNSTYSVTLSSPAGQSCTFSGAASGTVGAGDVTTLSVTCTTLSFAVGGTVSGLLNSTQVTLRNGADSIAVGNGAYTFPTPVAYSASYSASASSPTGQNCAFAPSNSNVGTMPATDVTVEVVCSTETFTLGGTIFGLVAGATVTLQNGVDSVQLGLGPFTFATPIAYGAGFTVSVSSPAGQQCNLAGTQAGPMPAANVSDIAVNCSPLSYSLGGTVSGLMYAETLILQNGVDMLDVSNGAYTFATAVPFNNAYNVTLRAPGGQACGFTPGFTSNAGTMPAAAIVDINVSCALVPYSISIAAPSSVVTADPFSITISIFDVAGNVLTGYTGTVQLSSSDAQGNPNTAPQSVVFGSGDQGVVTVSGLQLTSLGSQMLTATDALDQVQGEATITVATMLRGTAQTQTCGRFASGVEPGDAGLVSTSVADARHVALWPAFAAPTLRSVPGLGVAGSPTFIAMQGVGTGRAPTFASWDAFDVEGWHITLDEASYLSYWIFPVASDGEKAALSVGAYAALDIVFDDGSHTFAASLLDTQGHRIAPAAQGTQLKMNAWNHVQASLATFAGKRVQRLALGWQRDGAEGPFEVHFDAIALVGVDRCTQ